MNSNGELGLGHTNHESSPKKIILSHVTSVVSGHSHVMAMSEGTVYTWGYNRNGELGIGSNQNQSFPQKLNLLNALQVYCGGYCSFALLSMNFL
jgi:alpha-tubulin suppressor-like RCC1 family protein